jgi:hypothetical protein
MEEWCVTYPALQLLDYYGKKSAYNLSISSLTGSSESRARMGQVETVISLIFAEQEHFIIQSFSGCFCLFGFNEEKCKETEVVRRSLINSSSISIYLLIIS